MTWLHYARNQSVTEEETSFHRSLVSPFSDLEA